MNTISRKVGTVGAVALLSLVGAAGVVSHTAAHAANVPQAKTALLTAETNALQGEAQSGSQQDIGGIGAKGTAPEAGSQEATTATEAPEAVNGYTTDAPGGPDVQGDVQQ